MNRNKICLKLSSVFDIFNLKVVIFPYRWQLYLMAERKSTLTWSMQEVSPTLSCLILGTPSILFSNIMFLSVVGTGQGLVARSPVLGHTNTVPLFLPLLYNSSQYKPSSRSFSTKFQKSLLFFTLACFSNSSSERDV